MRTKLILTTAALGVASLGAFAQVYSVNAVGYINVTIPASGLALVANQLNTGDGNTIPEVFTAPRDGMTIYKYTPGTGFSINSVFVDGDEVVWDNEGQTLNPGEGAFVQNPEATEMTITFVGEVPQGTLSTPIAEGLNLISSAVPQAGPLTADALGMPSPEAVVYLWDKATQNYEPAYEAFDGEWLDDRAPVLEVGEAFWLSATEAGTWTREFSVNE